MPRYVALLRAITNVRMAGLRRRLEDLGFEDVESVASSGNLLFTTRRTRRALLERRISAKMGTPTLVRSRAEIARVARKNPYRRRPGATVTFLARPPSPSARRKLRGLEGARPILRGSVLYHVFPNALPGRRTPVDFERLLGVTGTARSARMVERIAERPS